MTLATYKDFQELFRNCILWWPGEHLTVTASPKTVSVYGNTYQTTMIGDPFNKGKPIAYFDGSGDYLTVPDSDDWNPTGDYTIGFWINVTTIPPDGHMAHVMSQGSTFNDCVYIGVQNSGGYLYVYWRHKVSGGHIFNVGYGIMANTWYYFEFIKYGSVARVYVNGTLRDTVNITGSPTNFSTVLQFGYRLQSDSGGLWDHYYNGFLCDFHMSKGIARHTSNFVTPTTYAIPDSYTKLLLHMNGSGQTFVDDAYSDVNEFPILPAGVTVTPNGVWTGDSILGNNRNIKTFDGSTNYILLSDNDVWYFYDNDFTLSGWFKFVSLPSSTHLIRIGQEESSTKYWYYSLNPSVGRLIIYIQGSSGILAYSYASFTPVINTWYHLTLKGVNGSFTFYINGIALTTVISQPYNTSIGNVSASLKIGATTIAGTEYNNGNIKDLIILKGTALSSVEINTLMQLTDPRPSSMGVGINGVLFPRSVV